MLIVTMLIVTMLIVTIRMGARCSGHTLDFRQGTYNMWYTRPIKKMNYRLLSIMGRSSPCALAVSTASS